MFKAGAGGTTNQDEARSQNHMSTNPTSIERISVGIVTYNSADVIGRTIESLSAAAPAGLEIEILIRDNGSRDNTVQLLEQLAHRIGSLRLLPGGDNIGYGRGQNAILREASGQLYVVCNPDIVVQPDFFARSIAFLETNPDVGIMSPRMTFSDGTLQHSNRRHPTVLDLGLRRFMPAFLKRRLKRIDRYEMADLGYDKSYDVPFCSGALMVCRAEALRQVGGFDERYFLYFEDADLSREIQMAGWRAVYNPDVSVVHGWQRAAHKNWRMTLIMMRNAVRYFAKWGWRLF